MIGATGAVHMICLPQLALKFVAVYPAAWSTILPRDSAAQQPADVPGYPHAVVEEERVGRPHFKVGGQEPRDRPPYHKDQWPETGRWRKLTFVLQERATGVYECYRWWAVSWSSAVARGQRLAREIGKNGGTKNRHMNPPSSPSHFVSLCLKSCIVVCEEYAEILT